MGAQWLSCRVLDSRPRGRRFEPHRRHCVVVLEQDIYPNLVVVEPRKTRPCLNERWLMGRNTDYHSPVKIHALQIKLRRSVVHKKYSSVVHKIPSSTKKQLLIQ